MSATITEAKCRYCGCTEQAACRMPFGPCHWLNDEKDVCSNPRCLAKWQLSKPTVVPTTRDELCKRANEALGLIKEARELLKQRIHEYEVLKAELSIHDEKAQRE